MICQGKDGIVCQNKSKSYCFTDGYYFKSLSFWIKDSSLDYTQIGPTLLVEWEE